MTIDPCTFDGNEEIAGADLATVVLCRLEKQCWIRGNSALDLNFTIIALQDIVVRKHIGCSIL
jgi:hypothetical protein